MRKVSLFALGWCVLGWAAVPTPREHFGFTPGDDYKLAGYTEIVSYFQKLDVASDRLLLAEFGRSSQGRPMYLAFISSAENLRSLDDHRARNRRLALGEATPEEARRLAAEGKAIVWIDSGLHATEVAPAQHAPHLAWRMVTDEGEEARRIRDRVILLQVPCINPDGLEMVVEWYRRNIGTPHELAPLPWLYQKYAGHDNNRDWFMQNLAETRHVSRVLFREWFPQIVYNQHQVAPFPARIFLPPYSEPLNPHIPAVIVQGINQIGAAMSERFARENKRGAIAYLGFDAWWDGGLRTVPAFHNMHGILTETAGAGYATPREYKLADLPERFNNGLPAREPTVFHPLPWLGGKWTLRDAIDYMLTADFAILDLAASRSAHYLEKAWELARAQIGAGREGKPYAYVVPVEQWDDSNAVEMLRRLELGGLQVHRARTAFEAGGKSYAAGTHVLLASQPFRAYLMDLLEPQKYPELRNASDGPTKRPYDIAGWTLPYQMGVAVDRVDDPFEAALDPVADIPRPEPSSDPRQNVSFLGRARGEPPRVALYEPWTANMDAGWTQWLLDYYRVPYTLIHNQDFQRDLRARFDSIILASQSADSLLHGTRHGESSGRPAAAAVEPKSVQRPEYTGGIGVEGLRQLQAFVRGGGTLIAFDNATELPIRFFPLPVRNVARGQSAFYCPGSLLRITIDSGHPLAQGMPKDAIAFSTGGHAFETTLLKDFNRGDREVRTVASYAAKDLLASGWVSGERAVLGKDVLVEARHGAGRVILFGFRPQFRGQSFGTFKLVLNAIYSGSR
jgi:hypothetical protein